MRFFLELLSGALYAAGFVPYIRGILAGRVRPARAAWIIWAVLDVVTCLMMREERSVNPQIFVAAVGGSIVALLSLKYGRKRWTKTDTACYLGAGLALGAWLFYRDVTIGMGLCLAAMCLGAIPMLRGAWQNPHHEHRAAWALYWLSCVVTLLTIPSFDFAHAAQPIVFFVIMTGMVALIYRRKRVRLGL